MGTKAVVAALSANIFIAVTKFGAWALTGASSMLAEAIHSVADSGNQVLLLVGGQAGAAGGHPGAPVRLRPRALHLRLHRGHGAVQRRRAVRPVRGVPQVRGGARRRAQRAARGPLVVGAAGRAGAAIIAESFSFRTAIVESNKVRGQQSWSRFIRRGQGARAAGDLAGGLRGAARPGVRAVRRRADPDHPERLLGRRRHRGDRLAAGPGGDHPGHRDQEPAARRVGRPGVGRSGSRTRWPASTAWSGSST